MSVYKLYGTASASTDAVAALDVRRDGKLECLMWQIYGTSAATGTMLGELSFGSSSSFTSNDTTQSISLAGATITSAGQQVTTQTPCDVGEIAVAQGERLFMHLQLAAGAITGRFTCFCFVNDGTTPKPRR
jgi:hypothetical protein